MKTSKHNALYWWFLNLWRYVLGILGCILILMTIGISSSLLSTACSQNPPVRASRAPATQPFAVKSVISSQPFSAQAFKYVPPLPGPPPTYNQCLILMHMDKNIPLLVHGVCSDRQTIYSMFEAQAKFYALNIVTTWFWGDGSSSTGGNASHTYSQPGTYTVTIFIDVSFRGGSTCRIENSGDIIVETTGSDPVITISDLPDFAGTPGSPVQTVEITTTNTGGRDAILSPRIVVDGGTLTDFSWINFTPKKSVVKNDGLPVVFSMVLDWPHATIPGTATIRVNFVQDVLISAWWIKCTGATVW